MRRLNINLRTKTENRLQVCRSNLSGLAVETHGRTHARIHIRTQGESNSYSLAPEIPTAGAYILDATPPNSVTTLHIHGVTTYGAYP